MKVIDGNGKEVILHSVNISHFKKIRHATRNQSVVIEIAGNFDQASQIVRQPDFSRVVAGDYFLARLKGHRCVFRRMEAEIVTETRSQAAIQDYTIYMVRL